MVGQQKIYLPVYVKGSIPVVVKKSQPGSSYKSEKIVSASIWSRPANNALLRYLNIPHYGAKVNTDKGNCYLIHSVPNNGTVVTSCSNMRPNTWSKVNDLQAKGEKTVGNAFKYVSGRTTWPYVNYATSGTCIKTTANVAEYLRQ